MRYEQLAILTPSRIGTRQRHAFASAACASLYRHLGGPVAHYVVHDCFRKPACWPECLWRLTPKSRWDRSVDRVYGGREAVRLIKREGAGSALALRTAVESAMKDGKTFAFIHLDDHAYAETLGHLLHAGLDAMEQDKDLLWVRYSDYPIICQGRRPLEAIEDTVSFDRVVLKPVRREAYTLWASGLEPAVMEGDYWPVAMWLTLYRLPVLARLLDWAIEAGVAHLGYVEIHYKAAAGFAQLCEAFPNGRFGYVNMQFAGFETHRNANWRELMELPNEGLR